MFMPLSVWVVAGSPLSPVIISKLYWSLVVPQMAYGLEIIGLSRYAEAALETAHNGMAKIAQGLPRCAANAAALPPLGWWSMHSCYHTNDFV